MTLPIVTRLLDRTDEGEMAFVRDSWLRSSAKGPMGALVQRPVYMACHGMLLDALIPRCTITVAELRSAPGIIIGWSAASGPVAHYVYTKSAYRRQGVASALLSGLSGPCSHWTHRANAVQGWKARFTHNPWLAWLASKEA